MSKQNKKIRALQKQYTQDQLVQMYKAQEKKLDTFRFARNVEEEDKLLDEMDTVYYAFTEHPYPGKKPSRIIHTISNWAMAAACLFLSVITMYASWSDAYARGAYITLIWGNCLSLLFAWMTYQMASIAIDIGRE